MDTRHLAAAALGLTLLLGACGSGSSGTKASSATTTTAPEATPVTTVAPGPAAANAPAPAVRTDDLDAQLSAVDRELSGAEQSVNQANDTSPDRADD